MSIMDYHNPLILNKEQILQAAHDMYEEDDIKIGEKIIEAENGHWVEAWVWVSDEIE